MLENLNVISQLAEDGVEIDVLWRWKYNGEQTLPSCTVFCCKISEEQILSGMLFNQDEIKKWICREVVDISSPKTRSANIEAYYYNPSNNGNCTLNKCQLINGGNIDACQMLKFPLTDANKLFFVCVYGEKTFESKVLSVDTGKEIVPQVTSPGVFEKIRGLNYKKLTFDDSENGRRVIITTKDGVDVYSICPNAQELYVAPDTKPEDIKIVYLSSLIGNL